MARKERFPPLLMKAAYVLAFLHLSIIGLVIVHTTDNWLHRGWWERPMVYWSGLNYSLWRYGFFSPDVGKSSEIEITIDDGAGHLTRLSTLEGFRFFTSNRESLNRFYGFKVQTARDEAFQDLCARSVTARLLNDLEIYQGGLRIEYVMRSIHYPTMEGFQKEEPVRTVEFYRTTFVLQ
jgi:hypothetical protein